VISANDVEGQWQCAEPVQLWSAETPHVYCLVVKVVDSEGTREGIEASQVAFRHSCIRNGQLLHNGRPIMLRGVNRHEHDPLVGKVGCFHCHNLQFQMFPHLLASKMCVELCTAMAHQLGPIDSLWP
jgi:hypothetical protein